MNGWLLLLQLWIVLTVATLILIVLLEERIDVELQLLFSTDHGCATTTATATITTTALSASDTVGSTDGSTTTKTSISMTDDTAIMTRTAGSIIIMIDSAIIQPLYTPTATFVVVRAEGFTRFISHGTTSARARTRACTFASRFVDLFLRNVMNTVTTCTATASMNTSLCLTASATASAPAGDCVDVG